MFGKKLIVASVVSLTSLGALASYPVANVNEFDKSGFYVGAQGGYSQADFGSAVKDITTQFPNNSYEENGIGGRFFAGWHFNQFFDTELGYNLIPTNKYNGNGGVFNDNTLDVKEKSHAWDLVGKASLPLTAVSPKLANVSLYGKAGVAYVNASIDANLNGNAVDVASSTFVTGDKNSIEPTYGVGLSYNFNKNVVADLSWTQIYGKDSDADGVNTPLINFYGVGLAYRFV